MPLEIVKTPCVQRKKREDVGKYYGENPSLTSANYSLERTIHNVEDIKLYRTSHSNFRREIDNQRESFESWNVDRKRTLIGGEYTRYLLEEDSDKDVSQQPSERAAIVNQNVFKGQQKLQEAIVSMRAITQQGKLSKSSNNKNVEQERRSLLLKSENRKQTALIRPEKIGSDGLLSPPRTVEEFVDWAVTNTSALNHDNIESDLFQLENKLRRISNHAEIHSSDDEYEKKETKSTQKHRKRIDNAPLDANVANKLQMELDQLDKDLLKDLQTQYLQRMKKKRIGIIKASLAFGSKSSKRQDVLNQDPKSSGVDGNADARSAINSSVSAKGALNSVTKPSGSTLSKPGSKVENKISLFYRQRKNFEIAIRYPDLSQRTPIDKYKETGQEPTPVDTFMAKTNAAILTSLESTTSNSGGVLSEKAAMDLPKTPVRPASSRGSSASYHTKEYSSPRPHRFARAPSQLVETVTGSQKSNSPTSEAVKDDNINIQDESKRPVAINSIISADDEEDIPTNGENNEAIEDTDTNNKTTNENLTTLLDECPGLQKQESTVVSREGFLSREEKLNLIQKEFLSSAANIEQKKAFQSKTKSMAIKNIEAYQPSGQVKTTMYFVSDLNILVSKEGEYVDGELIPAEPYGHMENRVKAQRMRRKLNKEEGNLMTSNQIVSSLYDKDQGKEHIEMIINVEKKTESVVQAKRVRKAMVKDMEVVKAVAEDLSKKSAVVASNLAHEYVSFASDKQDSLKEHVKELSDREFFGPMEWKKRREEFNRFDERQVQILTAKHQQTLVATQRLNDDDYSATDSSTEDDNLFITQSTAGRVQPRLSFAPNTAGTADTSGLLSLTKANIQSVLQKIQHKKEHKAMREKYKVFHDFKYCFSYGRQLNLRRIRTLKQEESKAIQNLSAKQWFLDLLSKIKVFKKKINRIIPDCLLRLLSCLRSLIKVGVELEKAAIWSLIDKTIPEKDHSSNLVFSVLVPIYQVANISLEEVYFRLKRMKIDMAPKLLLHMRRERKMKQFRKFKVNDLKKSFDTIMEFEVSAASTNLWRDDTNQRSNQSIMSTVSRASNFGTMNERMISGEPYEDTTTSLLLDNCAVSFDLDDMDVDAYINGPKS